MARASAATAGRRQAKEARAVRAFEAAAVAPEAHQSTTELSTSTINSVNGRTNVSARSSDTFARW
jgi:hypothetical protein